MAISQMNTAGERPHAVVSELIETPPAYAQFVRIGYQDLRGVTRLSALPVTSATTDQAIIEEISRRWRATRLTRLYMWLLLLKYQTTAVGVVELNDAVSLESQTGEVAVIISKTIHDGILQHARTDSSVLAGLRTFVNSPQLLTSASALHPNTDALALILTWRSTKAPLFLLALLFAVCSILVGVLAGSLTKSLETGLIFAGFAATILTIIAMFIMSFYQTA